MILERWEPGVAAGDPGLSTNFIPMGVGAVTSVSDNATTDVLRANVAGTYNNISGLTNGEGTGAEFQFIVLDTGDVTVNITNRGTGYNVNDTIQVLDSNLGGSGAPNITITALAVS